jgi:putative protease
MFETLKKFFNRIFHPAAKPKRKKVSPKQRKGSRRPKSRSGQSRSSCGGQRQKPKAQKKRAVPKKPGRTKAAITKKTSTASKSDPRSTRRATKKKAVSRTGRSVSRSKKKAVRPKTPKARVSKGSAKRTSGRSAASGRSRDVCVGEVTHFFSKISVVVLKMTHGTIRLGDLIRIQGKKTDLRQKVSSLQVESLDVKSAKKGQLVGLQVVKKVDVGDKVYKIQK